MQCVSQSFCIRAATTAETVGLPNCLIKVLRQWKSNVYHTYIKTPTCKDTMLSVSGLGHGILCTFTGDGMGRQEQKSHQPKL